MLGLMIRNKGYLEEKKQLHCQEKTIKKTKFQINMKI